ncbi:DUF1499 domain-containing protein [Mesorhizobium atlanticum]
MLDRRDWQLTAPYPDINGQSAATINALARGFVLGLPADVAIRVTDDGEQVIVDMRSASRYGRYDLGDNAACTHGFPRRARPRGRRAGRRCASRVISRRD